MRWNLSVSKAQKKIATFSFLFQGDDRIGSIFSKRVNCALKINFFPYHIYIKLFSYQKNKKNFLISNSGIFNITTKKIYIHTGNIKTVIYRVQRFTICIKKIYSPFHSLSQFECNFASKSYAKKRHLYYFSFAYIYINIKLPKRLKS